MKLRYTLMLFSIALIIVLVGGCTNNSTNSADKNSDVNTSKEVVASGTTESSGYFECSTNTDCSSSEVCNENKCVKKVEENALGHTREKPVSINTPLTIHSGYSWAQQVDAEITLLNVKRGDSAWNMLKEANQFNSEPEQNKEYLLTKFRIKILKTSDDKAYTLSSYGSLDAVSADGVVYDKPFVVSPKPDFSGDLYPGATKEAWAVFQIDKSDVNPLVSFNRDVNEQDSLWFNLK